MKLALLHTLDYTNYENTKCAYWRWFLGVDNGLLNQVTKSHCISYWKNNSTDIISTQHYDNRCSAHYFFCIEEYDRALADLKNNKDRWCYDTEKESFEKIREELKQLYIYLGQI